MKKIIENVKKPTPDKWQKRGNWPMIVVIFLFIFEDTLKAAPASIINPEITSWALKSLASVSLAFKAYTATKFDPNHYTGKP